MCAIMKNTLTVLDLHFGIIDMIPKFIIFTFSKIFIDNVYIFRF